VSLDLITPQPPEYDRQALPRDLARHARALLADPSTTSDHLLGTADCWDALAMATIAPAFGRPEDFARGAHMLRMVAELYAPTPLLRRDADLNPKVAAEYEDHWRRRAAFQTRMARHDAGIVAIDTQGGAR
jgi:hypothetical protein